MNARDDDSRQVMAVDADVVVVGAGAAGIGVARLLDRAGVSVLVLERAARPGDAWRRRYERLRLHTTRRWSHVAGTEGVAARERFVPAAAYADHVAGAASGIDVRCSTNVTGVTHGDDGVLVVRVASGALVRARHVVLATGQSDVPVEPDLPERAAFGGVVLHADAFRSGAALRDRVVLVVGAGNSGTEIAQDLVEHGAREVFVSMRSVPRIVPRAFGPVPAHAVAMVLRRVLGVAGMRRATRAASVIGGRLRLRRYGLYPPSRPDAIGVPTMDHGFVELVASGRIRVVAGLADLDADGAVLTDGSRLSCDAVILATGFRPRAHELIDPALAAGISPQAAVDPFALHDRGIWFVGFGPAPLGQLVLAREHAGLVAREVVRRLHR